MIIMWERKYNLNPVSVISIWIWNLTFPCDSWSNPWLHFGQNAFFLLRFALILSFICQFLESLTFLTPSLTHSPPVITDYRSSGASTCWISNRSFRQDPEPRSPCLPSPWILTNLAAVPSIVHPPRQPQPGGLLWKMNRSSVCRNKLPLNCSQLA